MSERNRAHTTRGTTADATEHRDARSIDDGLGDGLLRSEGVDGKDGIGVAVLDDREVSSVDKRTNLATEDSDAACLPSFLRHFENLMTQPGLDDRGFLLRGRWDHDGL